ncbi:hypothetical protein D4R47_02620 [archaeon]|nr:MAG: hypothetical protein D4R47_02620 [archaeon]
MKDGGLGDWRIRAVTRLIKRSVSREGHAYEAGSSVTLATVTEVGERQVLSFTTPSPPALALSIAIRAVRQAKELRKRLVFAEKAESYPAFYDKPEMEQLITSDTVLFDFFEECMTAMAFSFQALETFSNTIIAENLKHIYHLKRRKKVLKLPTDELQREASIEEKLGVILPEILSTKTPRGEKVWQDFKDLKAVRDTTIHMKALDAYSGVNIDKETFFYKLLNVEAKEFPRAAISMMAFFFKDDQLPRWLMSARDRLIES